MYSGRSIRGQGYPVGIGHAEQAPSAQGMHKAPTIPPTDLGLVRRLLTFQLPRDGWLPTRRSTSPNLTSRWVLNRTRTASPLPAAQRSASGRAGRAFEDAHAGSDKPGWPEAGSAASWRVRRPASGWQPVSGWQLGMAASTGGTDALIQLVLALD